jgi:uncharacterized protein
MNKLLLGLIIGSMAQFATAGPTPLGSDPLPPEGYWKHAGPIWEKLAEQGDRDAAFKLGQAYMKGRGPRKDLVEAQDWFHRAARLGHVEAQATLGLLLFQNNHQPSAMLWLDRAAEAGEPRALLFLGTRLYLGDGSPKDEVRAYALVSRAAAQGLAAAKATLADMDSRMPLEQRKKGAALALQMESLKTPASPATAHTCAAVAEQCPLPMPAVAVAEMSSGSSPAPANPAPARRIAAAPGGWRIQLGAFKQRGAAEAHFAKLSAALAGNQPYYVPFGALVRLQIGPFQSRASAAAACSKLAPNPCFAVAAN